MPNKSIDLNKQLRFATALTLTRVAQEAQKEIISHTLPQNFTLRRDWSLARSQAHNLMCVAWQESYLTRAQDCAVRHESGTTLRIQIPGCTLMSQCT